MIRSKVVKKLKKISYLPCSAKQFNVKMGIKKFFKFIKAYLGFWGFGVLGFWGFRVLGVRC